MVCDNRDPHDRLEAVCENFCDLATSARKKSRREFEFRAIRYCLEAMKDRKRAGKDLRKLNQAAAHYEKRYAELKEEYINSPDVYQSRWISTRNATKF